MAISTRPGEVFRQPELARTLTRIEQDPRSFYHGALASELAKAIQKHGGLVSKKDLAIYQVKDRKPLTGTYRQYEILAPPPPSSGGIALLETLNILEGFDLAALGDRTPDSMHLIIEAFRRAFDDRTSFLGDPDFAVHADRAAHRQGLRRGLAQKHQHDDGDPLQYPDPAAGLHSRLLNQSRPRTIPYSTRPAMQCQLRIP